MSYRVEQLCDLAIRGLQKMHVGAGMFVQTVRGIETGGDRIPRGEGDSLRYAAIVALGLSRVDVEIQREVLKGRTAADLALIGMKRAEESHDAGAIALSAWATAEVSGEHAHRLFDRLAELLAPHRPVETVVCAWVLAAALATDRRGVAFDLVTTAASRLLSGQASSGLFPHILPERTQSWGRAHVGSFADQVYPIQALTRLAVVDDDMRALAAANTCADRIDNLQGAAGQWWWHYDVTDGSVVEGYPVYSVHQHAMAPMALLELTEAGGKDSWDSVIRGFDWIDKHPESPEPLVAERDAVVWRKIGRREPKKAVRSISAVTTGLKTGWRLPGLDIAFPPGRIDYECRPYELGWMLYAWRSPSVLGQRPLRGEQPHV